MKSFTWQFSVGSTGSSRPGRRDRSAHAPPPEQGQVSTAEGDVLSNRPPGKYTVRRFGLRTAWKMKYICSTFNSRLHSLDKNFQAFEVSCKSKSIERRIPEVVDGHYL